jgi:hypothetical protein
LPPLPRYSDTRRESSSPGTFLHVPDVEKHGRKAEVPHKYDLRAVQGPGESRSTDIISKSSSKSDSRQYLNASRSTDRSETPSTTRRPASRIDTQPSVVPNSLIGPGPNIPPTAAIRTSQPVATLIPQPPIVQTISGSAAASHPVESTILSTTSFASTGAGGHEITSALRSLNQDPSGVPASRVAHAGWPSPSESPIQNKTPQMQPSDTQVTGASSGHRRDLSFTSRPVTTRPSNSIEGQQVARNALLSAVARVSPPNVHLADKGTPPSAPPSHTRTEPLTSGEPPRDTRNQEPSAGAGNISGLIADSVVHQPRSRPPPPEDTQTTNHDSSLQLLLSSTSAAASFTQRPDLNLSPYPPRQTTDSSVSATYPNASTLSQGPEDGAALATSKTALLHQIQGQSQKLFSSTQPVERETTDYSTTSASNFPELAVKSKFMPERQPPDIMAAPRLKLAEAAQAPSSVTVLDVPPSSPITSNVKNDLAGPAGVSAHVPIIHASDLLDGSAEPNDECNKPANATSNIPLPRTINPTSAEERSSEVRSIPPPMSFD